jgi:hypothetical protein
VLAADDGDGGGRLDAERGETLVLGDLGNLELKGALAVDDGAPISREPREDGAVYSGA